MEEKWEKHSKKILGWDAWFTIDMALMKMITGDAGVRRLQTRILDALPSSGKAKSVEDALEQLKLLQRGDLCKYAGSQGKGDMETALQTLTEIQAKMMPARVANPTPFVQALWLRLPFFAAVEKVSKKGTEEEKKLLMGQEAVDHMWQSIQSTAEGEVQQKDIDNLGVWAWMLTQEERSKLHALSMKLLSGKQATPAKRLLKGGEQKTSKKSKQKHEAENSAALAFLGVK
eukprot:6464544-Amphidinium_carterae.1